MTFNNWERVGKPMNPHLLPHVPFRFTNRQIRMAAERIVGCNAPFEGALMGSSTVQYLLVELIK